MTLLHAICNDCSRGCCGRSGRGCSDCKVFVVMFVGVVIAMVVIVVVVVVVVVASMDNICALS